MVNIAICDDNRVFLDQVTDIIKTVLKCDNKINKFSSAQELLNYIEEYRELIDIVVTDIKMEGIDGLSLAKLLREKAPNIEIIFVTSYTDYIEESFGCDPVSYIVKPVKPESMETAFKKAMSNIESKQKNCLDIITKTKILRFPHKEIKYIDSNKRVVTIHTNGGSTEVMMKLDDVQAKLPNGFLRVHKSYLVNIYFVASIGCNRVKLVTGEDIPVAKSKYKDIKAGVIKYLGGEK